MQQSGQWCLEVLRWLGFQKHMAQQWLLVTPWVYKNFHPAVRKGHESTQHMPSHSFVKALDMHMKVHKFFHTTLFQLMPLYNFIVTFKFWSEAMQGFRVVTRPSSHVQRVWEQDDGTDTVGSQEKVSQLKRCPSFWGKFTLEGVLRHLKVSWLTEAS